MRVRYIHHVALVVRDLERACRFYETVLGLRRTPRDATAPREGVWFRLGRVQQLHLVASDDAIPLLPHVALEVEDFWATLRHFKQMGVEIQQGPSRRGDGSDFCTIRDPDGNRIEVVHHALRPVARRPRRRTTTTL